MPVLKKIAISADENEHKESDNNQINPNNSFNPNIVPKKNTNLKWHTDLQPNDKHSLKDAQFGLQIQRNIWAAGLWYC